MSFVHQLVSNFGNELTFEDTNINQLFYSHSLLPSITFFN